MSTAKKITQTFNGRAEWGIAGDYFKLLSTVNPVDLVLFLRGQQVLVADDAEGGFYQEIAFDRIEITTGASEAVSFLAAPARGGSDRFTGDVDLIDQKTRQVGLVLPTRDWITDAGEAFRAQIISGAVAAQYSHAQLFNPVGSGKIVYVDSFIGYVSNAAGVQLTLYDTALTDSAAGVNMKSGGAASSARAKYTANAAGLGTAIGLVGVPAGESRIFEFKNPIRLDAGKGLCAYCGIVNTTISGSFEYREVSA